MINAARAQVKRTCEMQRGAIVVLRVRWLFGRMRIVVGPAYVIGGIETGKHGLAAEVFRCAVGKNERFPALKRVGGDHVKCAGANELLNLALHPAKVKTQLRQEPNPFNGF